MEQFIVDGRTYVVPADVESAGREAIAAWLDGQLAAPVQHNDVAEPATDDQELTNGG